MYYTISCDSVYKAVGTLGAQWGVMPSKVLLKGGGVKDENPNSVLVLTEHEYNTHVLIIINLSLCLK